MGVRLQHHKSTRPHGTSHRSLALTKFSSRRHFLTKNGAVWPGLKLYLLRLDDHAEAVPALMFLRCTWCVKCCREKYYSIPCPWPRLTTLKKNGPLALERKRHKGHNIFSTPSLSIVHYRVVSATLQLCPSPLCFNLAHWGKKQWWWRHEILNKQQKLVVLRLGKNDILKNVSIIWTKKQGLTADFVWWWKKYIVVYV